MIKLQPHGEGGYSLIEMLVAMLIFAAISVGFYQVVIMQSRTADTTRSVSSISQEARTGFDRMVRDVREADLISVATSAGTSFTIKVNYNGDQYYQNPNSAGDSEILAFAYDAANKTITLNGEVLMGGVVPVPSKSMFTFTDDVLDYDWDNNGQTSWLEVDQASCASHGVTGVGNCNSTLDAGEFPFLTTVTFAIQGQNGSRSTNFYATAQMRNRV
jgi:prepilin-type N-terminal cleavage/methylation domain-containing protein